MFKFITICLMAAVCVVNGNPSGIVPAFRYTSIGDTVTSAGYASPYAAYANAPLAYQAGRPYAVAAYHSGPVPAAYQVGGLPSGYHSPGYASPVIVPFATSINSHRIAHSAAYSPAFAQPETSYEGVTIAAAYQAVPAAADYEYGHVVDAAPGPANYV